MSTASVCVFLAYLASTNIILLNLLIAILTDTYSIVSVKSNAEQRNTFIKFSMLFQMDKDYGIFTLFYTPLTAFIMLISPLLLTVKPFRDKMTRVFVHIFYTLEVVPLAIVYSLAVEIVISIPCLFVVLVYYGLKRQWKMFILWMFMWIPMMLVYMAFGIKQFF
jgi:hypothetical protein